MLHVAGSHFYVSESAVWACCLYTVSASGGWPSFISVKEAVKMICSSPVLVPSDSSDVDQESSGMYV